MSEKALVIRAEGNSHVLEFSPRDLRDVISDIVRSDDVIGILFLDRLYSYPERDRCPSLLDTVKTLTGPELRGQQGVVRCAGGDRIESQIDSQILVELREIKTLVATLVSFQQQMLGWLVFAVIGSALGTRLLEWVVKRLNNKGF
jgi:hypothetical protein